jgi:hypothetical protein
MVRAMGWKSHEPKLKRPPRLTLDEWRALARACKQLTALGQMLHASGWNGKAVALVELAQAYEVIAGIYNRTEATVRGLPWPPPTEKPQDASGEGGLGGSSGGSQSAAPAAPEA